MSITAAPVHNRTTAAALYLTRISHVRRTPLHHAFHYRGYSWFFDIDTPPRLPWPLRALGSLRAADHLDGDPEDSLRTRVQRLLARHGITCEGRITALMSPRTLGYVFDPLSLFWCHHRDGSLQCVIAEVHNTYGQRHAYVVEPDEHGHAEVAKSFYVSPFNTVDGHYRLRVPEPTDTLSVQITLHRADHQPFHAGVVGTRAALTPRTVLAAQLRVPLAGWLTMARIRRHGLALWARRLPIIPRPQATTQTTTTGPTTRSRTKP